MPDIRGVTVWSIGFASAYWPLIRPVELSLRFSWLETLSINLPKRGYKSGNNFVMAMRAQSHIISAVMSYRNDEDTLLTEAGRWWPWKAERIALPSCLYGWPMSSTYHQSSAENNNVLELRHCRIDSPSRYTLACRRSLHQDDYINNDETPSTARWRMLLTCASCCSNEICNAILAKRAAIANLAYAQPFSFHRNLPYSRTNNNEFRMASCFNGTALACFSNRKSFRAIKNPAGTARASMIVDDI